MPAPQTGHSSMPIIARVFPQHHLLRVPGYTGTDAPEHRVPVRHLWFPEPHEARALVDEYIDHYGSLHRITHHPSLPPVVDYLYGRLSDQDPADLGHMMLLLSIFASAAYSWSPSDSRSSLFPSPTEAHKLALLWTQASLDLLKVLLDNTINTKNLSLELIQGTIIVSFVVANLDGLSLRFRSLMSTAIMLSREMGLHRLDHHASSAATDPVRAEVSRRVWWHLVATDW